jgi:acyl-CoA reductase-like NAD-dependent aldehyde dehydrogenase
MKIFSDLIIDKQTIKIPNYINNEKSYNFEDKEIQNSSYFDSSLKIVTGNTQIADLIRAIQSSKKNSALFEEITFASQMKQFEAILASLEVNKEKIATLEAHFQGTSIHFQLENSLKPLILKIKSIVANGALLEQGYFSAKPTIGVITCRSLSFFEIGKSIINSIYHKTPIIVKDSSQSAISSLIWMDIIAPLELPNSFVQFVQGSGSQVGNFLVQHPGLVNISFSGSFNVAKTIFKNFDPIDKKYQMFLGGKNSMVVLADFDFKKNMNKIVKPLVSFSGKFHLSFPRVYLTEAIEKEFKKSIQDALSAIKPLTSVDQEFGFLPLTELEKEKFEKEIKLLSAEGANNLLQAPNFHFFSELPNCSEWHHQASSLPIFNLTSVKYQYEIQKWINNTPFGHSLAVFGAEEKAMKFAKKIEVENVWLDSKPIANDFLKGIKASGFGDLDLNLPSSFYSFNKKVIR